MKKQKGFTFIELIVVIAIIAILSIVVFSQYINLSSNAQTNVVANLASRLNSAARMNYYARSINPQAGVPIKNCRNVENTLEAPLPSGYTIASKQIPVNTLVNCTLKGPGKTKAKFAVRGIR